MLPKPMLFLLRALCGALFPTLAVASAAAQEFSAAVVSTDPETGRSNAAAGRVMVADGKVRLELPDFPDGHFVFDPKAGGAYFVRPAQRVFMEARQSSRLAQILVVVAPGDPCRQWQEVAAITWLAAAGRSWRCTPAGRDTVAGRDTIRYLAVAPDAQSYDVWIDPALRFPIKIRAEVHAIVTLTDIAEGRQPAAAFEVPAGFTRFDPQGLIDRIKQSDVWVESPATR